MYAGECVYASCPVAARGRVREPCSRACVLKQWDISLSYDVKPYPRLYTRYAALGLHLRPPCRTPPCMPMSSYLVYGSWGDSAGRRIGHCACPATIYRIYRETPVRNSARPGPRLTVHRLLAPPSSDSPSTVQQTYLAAVQRQPRGSKRRGVVAVAAQ